ncbi:MAG: cytochrome c nitrite reductase small subunit [Bacteroidetes bacterium]|nr:MAG: cytochrome c nitrite reductase small subunit [Bacteroidota bacterium]
MKKLLKRIKPPVSWQKPVIVLLGIFCGLAIYVFYVSKAQSYLGDNPETCINCHVMIPHYANWAHNSHGRETTCNDCHVPHDNIFNKYLFKAGDGLNHVTMFTFSLERQVIIMEEETRDLIRENCIRCHEKTVKKEFIYTVQPNYHNFLEERWCLDCHRETPHGKVNGLSSTPGALTIQKSKSVVAGWMEKELRIKN